MTARPFLRKGCNLTMSESDGVRLCEKNGEVIMQGKEIDGLYYYDVETIRGDPAVLPADDAAAAAASLSTNKMAALRFAAFEFASKSLRTW